MGPPPEGKKGKNPLWVVRAPDDSHRLKTPWNVKAPAFLARRLCRLHLSGQKAQRRQRREDKGTNLVCQRTINTRDRGTDSEIASLHGACL
ncbi:hypothetical protein EVAR_11617_1 [Eumeta japonica]|uniref:Uncharacterized protein n=1 Tax=Eumeta variegata TaxID=151549 RepID=A0A4C1WXW4_EUMVA|nr:hypothetical protein EVAR_11617_1 [Eumeta japonica]